MAKNIDMAVALKVVGCSITVSVYVLTDGGIWFWVDVSEKKLNSNMFLMV